MRSCQNPSCGILQSAIGTVRDHGIIDTSMDMSENRGTENPYRVHRLNLGCIGKVANNRNHSNAISEEN